jgi:PAS domain S-box-containing protein
MTVLLFATAYYVLQRLAFTLRFPPSRSTTIWMPGPLLFTALLLAPPRRWWMFYIGLCIGIFASFKDDSVIPIGIAMLTAQFYFGAVALGVWQVRRIGGKKLLENLTSVLVFFVNAVILIPVITATPLIVVLLLSGVDDLLPIFGRNVLSIALGTLIGTPGLVLTLANGRAWLSAKSWKQIAEIAALGVSLVLVGHVSFGLHLGDEPLPVLLYAPLPLLVWAAVRFELAGVSWALLLLAFQSTWGAINGHGPFASQAPANSVLQLQLFLLAISLPLIFLATEIHERRRAFLDLFSAERAVRQKYAELATIYHAAPVGLAFVDPQLRYIGINDSLAEINGVPAEAHLGRTIREVAPHLADAIEPIYRHVLKTGQPVMDLEVRAMTASQPGIERTWLVSRYPVRDAQGMILGVSTVMEETTERKQIEVARQELAHASRLTLLGEMTASIAHEINQPLGAILSNADAAEMLLESAPASLAEVRHILKDIRKDDLRASEVIRRLRTLLRKHEMEMRPVDLNEVISEVLGLIRAECVRRGVAVKTELAAALPLIRGDKVHLQQILLNLLLNGMDAMAHMICSRILTLGTALDVNGNLVIAVSDTGSGIPPDQLPRLFDPFFSTKNEGMGLGLPIARSLVEGHGGRIWAENNPPGGATFRFTLPPMVQESSIGSSFPRSAPLELIT